MGGFSVTVTPEAPLRGLGYLLTFCVHLYIHHLAQKMLPSEEMFNGRTGKAQERDAGTKRR